eukprot:TRINITY_DN4039_c0_g1_i1.p1 TRINITY_DN4039_c0_g1~~TRINITY_DN4039_c0_g1_i1.p1  ORF type:complete len:751 (-),score=233.67 TRINITY_DN4039_c0_g1_i1:84-2207(-)
MDLATNSNVAWTAAGATVVAVLFYILKASGGKRRTKLYSYETGKRKDGEGLPRRNARSPDKLLASAHPDITTLYNNFQRTRKMYPNDKCLGSRSVVNIVKEKKEVRGEMKEWQYFTLGPYAWLSYEEVGQRIDHIAAGLRQIGLVSGVTKVAIGHETQLEWTLTAQACFASNATVVTVYANLGQENRVYALNQTECEIIQVGAAGLRVVLNAVDKCPGLKTVIYVDELLAKDRGILDEFKEKNIAVYSLDEVEELGVKNPAPHTPPTPDDIAVIMYTSGSTGNPKGVMIAHSNMVAAMGGAQSGLTIHKDDVYLNYLPLAHVLALVVENACLGIGVCLGYGNPRTLVDTSVRKCLGDLRELSPTMMCGVPTVWNRVRQGALAKVGKSSPIVQFLFNTAYKAKAAALKSGGDTPFWNRLVFNKFKAQLGGRVRIVLSGGAPLSDEVSEFLSVCFSCPILQGYGLTETCGGGTVQELDDFDNGRVGPPITSTEIKLVDCPEMGYLSTNKPRPQGEVWLGGYNITKGYYKNPEKTAEEFHDEGDKKNWWFSTGDIGEWDEQGVLRIIDRIKNLIKPPHGEYIALEKLEAVFKNSRFVENVLVYADSFHDHCVAIVQPNEVRLLDWAKAEGHKNQNDFGLLCDDPAICKLVLEDLNQVGKACGLKSFELLRKCLLVSEEWCPENGYLTAAMKLARPKLNKDFKAAIMKMYE